MDRGLKTTAVAIGIGLAAGGWLTLAAAQSSYNSGYSYSDQSQYSDQYESPAQRNPELPTGLTIVPWKLERRSDREDLLHGGSGNDRGATTRGQ